MSLTHTWEHETLARGYLEDLLGGKRAEASKKVTQAVESGLSIKDLYLQVFQWSLYEVGRLWEENKVSVAQEHVVTASTQLIMSQFYPQIFAAERCNQSLVALCVEGNLHEVGLRMVCDFFEMEGWDTLFLGASTIEDGLVEVIRAKNPDLIAISATMKSHLPSVENMVETFNKQDWRCKILVGGQPFNSDPDLWKKVGADGVASDARKAVCIGKGLVA